MTSSSGLPPRSSCSRATRRRRCRLAGRSRSSVADGAPVRRRSWAEVRWRQFRNAPRPVVRAVLSSLVIAIVLAVAYLAYDLALALAPTSPAATCAPSLWSSMPRRAGDRHRRHLPRRAPADGLRNGPATERLECRARVLRRRADRLAGDDRDAPAHPAAARLSLVARVQHQRRPDDADRLVHPYHSRYRALGVIIRRVSQGIQGDHRTYPFEVPRVHRRAACRAPEALRSTGLRPAAGHGGDGGAAVRSG